MENSELSAMEAKFDNGLNVKISAVTDSNQLDTVVEDNKTPVDGDIISVEKFTENDVSHEAINNKNDIGLLIKQSNDDLPHTVNAIENVNAKEKVNPIEEVDVNEKFKASSIIQASSEISNEDVPVNQSDAISTETAKKENNVSSSIATESGGCKQDDSPSKLQNNKENSIRLEKTDVANTEDVEKTTKNEDENFSKEETDTAYVVTIDENSRSEFDPDEKYFSSLSSEELQIFKKRLGSPKILMKRILQCTSCHKRVCLTYEPDALVRHPLLGVAICRNCSLFYDDGEWTRSEDGSDMFCRWCANGGDLILCDHCNHAFCRECLQKNLGRMAFTDIKTSESWSCLVCKPDQTLDLRAKYYEISRFRAKVRAEKNTIYKKDMATDFISQTIDAFNSFAKTLQHSFEGACSAWLQTEALDRDDFELMTMTTKKFRKLFIVHQRSLEELEQNIVSAYAAAFPSKDISAMLRMPGVPDVVNVDKAMAKPVKKKSRPNVNTSVVKKVPVIKKKVVPAIKKKSSKTLIMPKIKLSSSRNVKVSPLLFNSKARSSTRKRNIETITLEDDDTVKSKKRRLRR